MLRFRMTGLAALLGVAALTFTAQAQAQTPPPPLIFVARVVMKPDRVAECREISKRFSEAHQKTGSAFRHVWRSRAGNPHEYVTVTPVENYAQLDSPGPGRRGMSEGERAHLVARRRQCTESVELSYRRPIAELTIPWTTEQPPKMIRTVTTQLLPGMADQFIEHEKELVAAYKKADVPAYGVHRVMYGGTRTTFVSWYPLEKMADLDGPGWLAKSMSEDARAKWLEKLFPMLAESSEFNIWVYEPELSFQAKK